MIKGTTPVHVFNIPVDVTIIKEVKITYSQDGVEVLEKKTADVTLEEGKITVKLTQEDTFLFDCKKNIQIQVRMLTQGNDALASHIITTSVCECLDKEVLE